MAERHPFVPPRQWQPPQAERGGPSRERGEAAAGWHGGTWYVPRDYGAQARWGGAAGRGESDAPAHAAYGGPVPSPKRGPKNYRRSDERIREDICERLIVHPHVDASDVSVEVREGSVILDGTVSDRGMKHAIEDIAAACPGVEDVENRLRVTTR